MTVKTLSTRKVYENPWLSIREDAVEWPDGSQGVHAVVDKNPGAVIVPWDGERLTLVGQVKYPIGAFHWEFPQGAIDDDSGASAEETARTELLEETGLRAGRLERIGRLAYAPGVMSQLFDAWLATDLIAGEAQPEATEVGMRSRAFTPAEFDELVARGEIIDAATLGVLHLLRLHGVSPWG